MDMTKEMPYEMVNTLMVSTDSTHRTIADIRTLSSISHRMTLLDMASIHGKYLGESEGRFREALAMADWVAPCILWIDEIEKGLAGKDDMSGVPQRIIGQFLFWLQESRSRAFVVATANDVRSLPPELLRKGRFDELFFVEGQRRFQPAHESGADVSADAPHHFSTGNLRNS